MARPIDFQETYTKTLHAQKVADELHQGAEKAHDRHMQLAREEADRRRSADRIDAEEPTWRSEQSRKRGEDEKKRRRGKTTKPSAESEAEGTSGDEGDPADPNYGLRRRRPEDDAGKGDRIDMKV